MPSRVQHGLIIVNNRDGQGHEFSPGILDLSLRVTMAPPSPPPICSSPPWFSTIDLLKERPTPNPSAFEVVNNAGWRISMPAGIRAGVGHDDVDALAAPGIEGAERQAPFPIGARCHRVRRIGDEIDQDLLDLQLVGEDLASPTRGIRDGHVDAFPLQHRGNDVERLAKDVIHGFELELRAARA